MLFLNSLLVFILAIPLGLGIGGGGLFLIYLCDVLKLERDSAVYLNLVFFLSALLSATVRHLRNGRLSFPILGNILLFGVPGALLGRWFASLLSPSLLHLILGFFLLGAGVFSLLTLKKTKNEKEAPHSLDKY